jgi:hypothetical protein
MGFVERELMSLNRAIVSEENEWVRAKLYAAQQALSWVIEPDGFASPIQMIKGTLGEKADCQGYSCQPQS